MTRSATLSMLATAGLLAACGSAETPTRGAPERIAATERPAGTIVFVTDANRLNAIDVASGRRVTRRMRSLPACGSEVFVTGGRIVFSGVVKGLTTVFSVPLSLDRRPTPLGTTHAFVPSATEGRVWLAGTDCDRPALIGVREVAVDGRVTFESDRRVSGSWVAGAVPDGLVIQRGRALLLWDPGTGRTGGRLGLDVVFQAHGNLLSGCADASDCREVAVVDTRTGRTVVARPSGRYELDWAARFSPDGSRLATPVRDERRWSVALIDARTGTYTIIPGSRTGEYPELGWARSSGWLFIRGVDDAKWRHRAALAATSTWR